MRLKTQISRDEVIETAFMEEMCPAECPWLHRWEERHPYGEGYAAESLCECELRLAQHNPELDYSLECPVFDSTKELIEARQREDLGAE
jgi:hypothetical protein